MVDQAENPQEAVESRQAGKTGKVEDPAGDGEDGETRMAEVQDEAFIEPNDEGFEDEVCYHSHMAISSV